MANMNSGAYNVLDRRKKKNNQSVPENDYAMFNGRYTKSPSGSSEENDSSKKGEYNIAEKKKCDGAKFGCILAIIAVNAVIMLWLFSLQKLGS